MRVLVTSTEVPDALVRTILSEMSAALSTPTLSGHVLVADPIEADAILFVESARNKFRDHGSVLRKHETIREFPNKVFAFDFTDAPAVFLPGAYVSLPARRFERRRCRAIPPWGRIGEELYRQVQTVVSTRAPELLFSFRGAESASVRSSIFAAGLHAAGSPITRMERWWDYDDQEADRLEYLAEIKNSRFVLCPRGLGTSSFRLYEVMQLGRVPVILSDEWVAPAGVPWEDCSIWIAEDRVREIPSILQRLESRAPAMGLAARRAWEEWCEPGPTLMRRILQSIEGLMLRRDRFDDERRFQRQWSGQRFAWANGWHPLQGSLRAAREDRLVEKLVARTSRRSLS